MLENIRWICIERHSVWGWFCCFEDVIDMHCGWLHNVGGHCRMAYGPTSQVHFYVHFTFNMTDLESKMGINMDTHMDLYSVKQHRPMEKTIWCRRHFTYLHHTNIFVYTIIYIIKQTKFHICITIIGRISLFVHVTYSSAGLHCTADRQKNK